MQHSLLYSINSDSILERLMSASGYCSEHFSSLQDFLDCFSNKKIGGTSSRAGCILLNFSDASIDVKVLAKIKQSTIAQTFPVIVFAEGATVMEAVQFIKSGAWHFFGKTNRINFEKFRSEVEGAMNYSMTMLTKEILLKHYNNKARNLTEREHEVMLFIAKGFQNKTIADRLNISDRTVEIHRARVYKKLEVKSAIDLANVLANVSRTVPKLSTSMRNESSYAYVDSPCV